MDGAGCAALQANRHMGRLIMKGMSLKSLCLLGNTFCGHSSEHKLPRSVVLMMRNCVQFTEYLEGILFFIPQVYIFKEFIVGFQGLIKITERSNLSILAHYPFSWMLMR